VSLSGLGADSTAFKSRLQNFDDGGLLSVHLYLRTCRFYRPFNLFL